MRVIVKDTKAESLEKTFPKMMKTEDGLLVYFTEPKEGSVIQDNTRKSWSYGQESKRWDMSGFTDFEGVVELRNDWVESI
jgi:predicted transcriptional regulator